MLAHIDSDKTPFSQTASNQLDRLTSLISTSNFIMTVHSIPYKISASYLSPWNF